MKPSLLAALVCLSPALAPATPPNILLILVDDLKPLTGAYGDAHAHTPHLDRLAGESVRFDRAYCNQAVCAPSRNALFTGLRPDTIGVYDLGTFFRHAVPAAVTLPQHFRAAGYHVVGLGKTFHTYHGNQNDALSWDETWWMPRPGALARPVAPGEKRPVAEAGAVGDDFYNDGMIAAEAVRRLEAYATADPGQPFFLTVGFLKPHLPFTAPRAYWELHDRAALPRPARDQPPAGAPSFAATRWGELRAYAEVPPLGPVSADLAAELIHGYYAAVSYVDAQIGRVLQAWRELGLVDNTIVVVWGDHGFHLGDHGFWCKHTLYEEANRIPLFIAAPGLEPGVVTAPVETVALYPTLAELAGLPVPAGLDGTSLGAALRDPAAAREGVAWQVYPRGDYIGRAVRTPRHRLIEWRRPGDAPGAAGWELYDYEADPAESRNLADEQPELVAALRPWLESLPPPRPPWRPHEPARIAQP